MQFSLPWVVGQVNDFAMGDPVLPLDVAALCIEVQEQTV